MSFNFSNKKSKILEKILKVDHKNLEKYKVAKVSNSLQFSNSPPRC